MKSVLCFLDIYVSYIGTFFRARGEYRFGFFAGMFANFYCYLITFATFWVITSRFGSIAGWGFEDMSVLYGLNLLTYAISGTMVWYTVFHLEREITSGGLDRYLVRPMNLISQMMCQRFGDTFLGQIVVTAVFLCLAFTKQMGRFTPLIALYTILAVLGGILLQTGAMILVGSLSFWTLRSSEAGHMVYYDLRTLTHYPLVIYPRWIRLLLTFVFPWAFINYYPALIILGKPGSAAETLLGWFSPLVGLVVLAVGLLTFQKGLARYSGSGS